MKKINKKISRKKSKALFIIAGAWILAFLFVSFGYASFTSQLDVQTTAMIDAYFNENFDITDMGIGSSSGGTSMSLSRMGKEIKGSVYSDVCGGYVIYNFTLMNKTPYLAYISNLNVKSLTNDQGLPTTGFDIEMLDITPNVSYLEAYETKIIQVKITNNCTTNDHLANFIFEFDFSLVKYYEYTLNATPSDANITITTSRNKTYSGVGSVTANIYEGDTINYTVSKYLYETTTSSTIMPSQDYTTNVVLIESPLRTLTYTINPSTAVISCVDINSNSLVLNHQGSGSTTVYLNQRLRCTVGDEEYYYSQDSNGNFTDYSVDIDMNENKSISVTLIEKPWITGTYLNTNRGTATTGTLRNYHPGYYLIEIWGGKGGRDYQKNSTSGTAGYIYATVYLRGSDSVYYSLGGNGEDGKLVGDAEGGANGGADAVAIYPGGGGGYSALAINTQTINEENINNGNVLLIAGGGGGCASANIPTGKNSFGNGGNGGTLSTTHLTNSIGHVYSGTAGGYNKNSARAGGGGGTSGGAGGHPASGSNAQNGSLLAGGRPNSGDTLNKGGAGGAGYYGGGGGSGRGTSGDGGGSGGGGSSLISTKLGLCTPGNSNNGSLVGTNPSSTGGAVIISYVGKTLSN